VVVILMAAALLSALVSCDDNTLPEKSGEAEPAADVRVLAERYAPIVWLAEGDEYGPGDASRAAEGASLWLEDRCGELPRQVADRVELRRLGGRDEAYSASSCTGGAGGVPVRSDEAAAGDRGGFFLNFDDSSPAGDPKTAPLYWQSIVDGNRSAIVYWFFYPYNDFINDHEGDWERIAVQFRDGQSEPIGVTFWKHTQRECFVWWRELDVDGNRPVVYSASGSHGSYPWPGTYDTFVADKVNDVATKGTRWAGRPRSVVEEPWWGYRGRWGNQVGIPGMNGPFGPHPDRPTSRLGGEGCARPDTPEVPEVFQGAWHSPAPVVNPTSDRTTTVEMTISERVDGDVVGQSRYPGLECQGVLRFSRSDPSTLVVTEHIEEDGTFPCPVDGSITLRPDGDGLRWEYTEPGASQVTATAHLVRKDPSVPEEPQEEPPASTIPEAFLHQWQAPEPMSRPGLQRPYYVRLQLWGEDAPLATNVEGLSEYSEDFGAVFGDLACSGDLALVEASADKVVFEETERGDAYGNCPDEGTVTLTLSGDQLIYDYVGGGGSAHTTLVRR